jgi:DNA-binding NarL/FixJ family response regulator
MVRECLKLYIAQEPDFEVTGEASTAREAALGIERNEPDVVIFDISLPGMNGLEFFKNLKTRYPKIAGVVLSMHDEAVYAERALRAGALGYVMKKESTDQLIVAIRKAIRGEYFVSTDVTGAIFNKALGVMGPGKVASESPVSLLSDRELEVFEKIGRGMTTRDISAELHLSPKTVEAHRLHIKEKLQLSSAAELIRYALRWVEYETTGRDTPRSATFTNIPGMPEEVTEV